VTRASEKQAEKGRSGEPPGEGAPEPYDKLVERLEQVVTELESGGLSLERSIEKFSEGTRLVRDAARRLDEAERRVEQLVKSAGDAEEEGAEEEVPFEPGAGRGPGDGNR
jgi:exodeoxyribonuclease VII small subunit